MDLNGSTNWLSKESRPDLACQTNQNQQCLPNPTVGQIRNANAVVRRAKQFSDISLTYQSIPVSHLKATLHTDASKNNAVKGGTQAG